MSSNKLPVTIPRKIKSWRLSRLCTNRLAGKALAAWVVPEVAELTRVLLTRTSESEAFRCFNNRMSMTQWRSFPTQLNWALLMARARFLEAKHRTTFFSWNDFCSSKHHLTMRVHLPVSLCRSMRKRLLSMIQDFQAQKYQILTFIVIRTTHSWCCRMIKKDSLYFSWCHRQATNVTGRYNDRLRLRELSCDQTEVALNAPRAKSTTALI